MDGSANAAVVPYNGTESLMLCGNPGMHCYVWLETGWEKTPGHKYAT